MSVQNVQTGIRDERVNTATILVVLVLRIILPVTFSFM